MKLNVRVEGSAQLRCRASSLRGFDSVCTPEASNSIAHPCPQRLARASPVSLSRKAALTLGPVGVRPGQMPPTFKMGSKGEISSTTERQKRREGDRILLRQKKGELEGECSITSRDGEVKSGRGGKRERCQPSQKVIVSSSISLRIGDGTLSASFHGV